MNEYLVVFCCLVFYAMGFMTCGALIGRTSFWNGVRYVFAFEFANDLFKRRTK